MGVMQIPRNHVLRSAVSRCCLTVMVVAGVCLVGADPAGATPRYRAVSFAELGYPESALVNSGGLWAATTEDGHLQYFDGMQRWEWKLGAERVTLYRITEGGDVFGSVLIRVRRQTSEGEVEDWIGSPFFVSKGELTFWGSGPESTDYPSFLGECGHVVGTRSVSSPYLPTFAGSGVGFVTDGRTWETFDADMFGQFGTYAGNVWPSWMNRSGTVVGMATFLLGEHVGIDFTNGGPIYVPDVGYLGFVREHGVLRRLVFPDDPQSFASRINDAGVIVGASYGEGRRRGFVDSGGKMVPWAASDPTKGITPIMINNFGVAVALVTSAGDPGSGEYLTWRAGVVRSLGAVTDFSGTDATQIAAVIDTHDDGVIIVDAATAQQTTRRFLLVPVEPATPTRLVNVSARAATRTGDGTLIAGFVNAGGENRVLVRTVGPGLLDYDVPGAATDPRLDLYRAGTADAIDGNDQWGEGPDPAAVAAAAGRVGAFALDPSSADAALLTTLPAGAYTVHTTAATSTGGGIALAEVYEDPGSPGRLVNASIRMWVGAGDEVGVVGFFLDGEAPARVLIRAVGPGLAEHGIAEPLADPQLFVYRGQSPTLGNDNWGTFAGFPLLASVTSTSGAFALDDGSADAALPLELEPGGYTVHVSGADGGTGVALVEIYLLEQ